MKNNGSRYYHFIFMDIVGFSRIDLTVDDQKEMLTILNQIIKNSTVFKEYDINELVIIPTGDGMVIGFPKSSEEVLKLAEELHTKLAEYNRNKVSIFQIHLRIGLHSGLVCSFVDITDRDNITGPGIIMAKRIMDIGDVNHILASDKIAEDLRKIHPEYENLIKYIGTASVKHDEPIIVYNIFNEKIGNRQLPQPMEIVDGKTIFRILNIHIELTLLNEDTMYMHHKASRTFKNVSDKPIEYHRTYIIGDVQKSAHDLNLNIYDDDGAKLTYVFVKEQSTFKEFITKFNFPLYKNDVKGYTIEWDDEESKRYWEYEFQNAADNFEFSLIYNKNTDLDLRCYEINIESGDKIISKNKPIKTEIDDNVKIRWTTKNVGLHTMFRFEW